ncbi:putative acetyltransferase [Bacillus sp. TS-2]|nr:putative acetyltransferase [Bacillus sp. TS-2]
MQNIKLVKPTATLKSEYIEFYRDWINSGEKMVPWVIKEDPEPFERMLQFLEDQESGEGLIGEQVKNSTFWLKNDSGKVVGAVNIRHELNGFLREQGGHIGYGIRPSERRKGYATELLKLALKELAELGKKEALVCCDSENMASFKTIKNNGGSLETDYVHPDGQIIKRFWVPCHF